MAEFYNLTFALKKPEVLVKACLDRKNTRKFKPQTMLNYLSIFWLFVDYCYLAQETKAMGNEHERMKVAIKDARKAFNPAAVEDYRKTSQEMLARVPPNEQVRER